MADQRRDVLPTYKGLRAAFFLFTRPFLLWPGTLATIVVWFWFVTTMMRTGHGTPGHFVTLVLIGPLVGFGFAVMTALPGFMLWRAIAVQAPELVRQDGERVLTARKANHWLGDEARGGTLHVTTRALVFVPHRFNVQLT